MYSLGHKNDCIAYLVKDNDSKLLSVSVRGTTSQCNVNIPLNVAHVAAIYARVEDNQAVVAYVTRVGSQPIINVQYAPFTGTIPAPIVSYLIAYDISEIRLAKIPGSNSHLVFVSQKIFNSWEVLTASASSTSLTKFETIHRCINLWIAESNDGALALFNNYKDSDLNLYAVAQGASKGVRSYIGIDGSFSEIKDISCYSDAQYKITCAAITTTPAIPVIYVTMNSTLQIPDGSVSTRGLLTYSVPSETGTYLNVDILPGYVVLRTHEGHIDLFRLDSNFQGYLYTRLHRPTSESASLKSSSAHLLWPRNYAITPGSGMPVITRINRPSSANDVEQLEKFQTQPI